MKIIFSLLIIFIVGCSTLETVETTDKLIQSGEVSETVRRANLSDIEITILNHGINSYFQFRSKYQLESSENIVSIEEFLEDYKVLKSNFLSVEKVVRDNINEYSEKDKSRLIYYLNIAKKNDKSVNSLIKINNTKEAIKEAIKLGIIITSIISKL